MKPIHLAALGAVLAVVAILFLALGDDGETASRTRTTREAPTRRPVDFDEYIPTDPPAPGTTYGCTLVLRRPNGAPATGARVSIRGRDTHTARAGSDGRVRFRGLAPGHYDLWARLGAAAGALGFELHADRDLGTLKLRVAVVVRGHVFDANKAPLSGATVEAVELYSGGSGWFQYTQRLSAPDTIAAQVSSGADGSYELVLPGKGRYGLRAWAAGYGAEVEGTRTYGSHKSGVDFYLLPGNALEGRVVDEGDRPVAGARVVAAVFAGQPRDIAPKVHAVTPADGSFRLTVPNAQRIHLAVTAAGYAKYSNPRLLVTGREIVVRLLRGVAVRLRTVEKGTERPIEGVDVTILFQGGSKQARSDGKGDVVIENLPASRTGGGGGLTALVVPKEFVPQRISLRNVKIMDGVLDVGAVQLEQGGVVRGTVRDKESGRPVVGATVRPFGGRSVRLSRMLSGDVRTEEDGRYELRGVPLDAATAIARHDDYVMDMPYEWLVKHMRGGGLFKGDMKEATVDIDLVPAKAVRGVVIAPNGDAVAGARVQTAMPLGGSINRILGTEDPVAISDAQGRFSLSGLKPNEAAKLLATHRDYGDSARVDAVAGGGDVTLHLEPPLLIRGIVLDESGAPIKGVRVSLTARQRVPRALRRGGSRPGYTDDKGAFAIRNAPSGELTLSFDHRGFKVVKREFAIDGAEGVYVAGTVTLSRGPGIEVLVTRANGSPLPDVSITASWAGKAWGVGSNRARPDGRTWGNAVSDGNGRAAIYGLAEGPFRLSVTGRRHYSDKPVVQTGSREVRLIVRDAATMQGHVVADGAGVDGAWVRAARKLEVDGTAPTWTNLITSARTSKDGSFTLIGLPPDETFDLTISHRSYRSKDVLGVTAGTGRRFNLDSGGRIAGVVVDEDGPVLGATMRIYRNGKATKWSRTDSKGRFEFSGLGTGDVEVQMQRSTLGHVPSQRTRVTVGATDIRIEVTRGVTITGKVIFRSAEHERGLMIEVIDSEGRTAGSAWATKARPTWTVRGLREATYTVRAVRWRRGDRAVVAERTGVRGSDEVELEVG